MKQTKKRNRKKHLNLKKKLNETEKATELMQDGYYWKK